MLTDYFPYPHTTGSNPRATLPSGRLRQGRSRYPHGRARRHRGGRANPRAGRVGDVICHRVNGRLVRFEIHNAGRHGALKSRDAYPIVPTGALVRARRIQAEIAQITPLGPGLARVDLETYRVGEGIEPGQFAMVAAPGRPDCILLRPYSYFTVVSRDRVGFLVKDVGRGTHALLQANRGAEVAVLGPLGNRFPEPSGRCWVVAGGVGAGPFGDLAAREGVRIIFGARSVDEAGFATALRALGGRVELATDDGSSGFKGSAVDCLRSALRKDRPDMLFTCGPTAMMSAVAQLAVQLQIPCWVSLEARMACGFGVCRSCVHYDATGGWRCVCDDGPVYPAELIFSAAPKVE